MRIIVSDSISLRCFGISVQEEIRTGHSAHLPNSKRMWSSPGIADLLHNTTLVEASSNTVTWGWKLHSIPKIAHHDQHLHWLTTLPQRGCSKSSAMPSAGILCAFTDQFFTPKDLLSVVESNLFQSDHSSPEPCITFRFETHVPAFYSSFIWFDHINRLLCISRAPYTPSCDSQTYLG